jgi:hypothetical protein
MKEMETELEDFKADEVVSFEVDPEQTEVNNHYNRK